MATVSESHPQLPSDMDVCKGNHKQRTSEEKKQHKETKPKIPQREARWREESSEDRGRRGDGDGRRREDGSRRKEKDGQGKREENDGEEKGEKGRRRARREVDCKHGMMIMMIVFGFLVFPAYG